jgi:phosphoribosylaminoimidazolecarboxamide formyltransferase / IMP cyclohydrolase
MAFNSVKSADDLVPVRNVIASVYDKTGLDELARGIVAAAESAAPAPSGGGMVAFYSTGATYDFLRGALAGLRGASLVKVSDYTGQPEMAGGLVKTLDWKIYLGLLSEKGNESHAADLRRYGAVAFDMVISNLYPFEAAAAASKAAPEDLRQNIDIGGPCMIRAAAKNYLRVASVSGPAQYAALLEELRSTGGRTRLETRRRLASEAFGLITRYDGAVSARLGGLDPMAVASAYGL